MIGNKINIKEIKSQEITIAKYGLLELICIVYPQMEYMSYELRTNDRVILETGSLSKAISKYNELAK